MCFLAMSFFYDVVFCMILIFICLQSNLVDAQSSCTTPRGHDGNCVSIDKCPVLFDVLNMMTDKKDIDTWNIRADFLRKSQCGAAVHKYPLVCCPKEHQNLHLVTNQKCGGYYTAMKISFKGKEVDLFEFPWMALIAYRIENKISFNCGGSLINSRYVLTAAHCLKSRYPVVGVRLGEHDIKRSPDCFNVKCPKVQDIPVEETIFHEKYSDKLNDIGLIRLSRPADLSEINVNPICLPVTPTLQLFSLINETSTVAGWGRTEALHFSDVLRQVKLTVIDNAKCQDMFSTPYIRAQHISPGMKEKFCAYGRSSEHSCTGDSGGPLMYLAIFGKIGHYVLYGIVSYGSKECDGSAPSVFTSVDAYLEWILDRLRP